MLRIIILFYKNNKIPVTITPIFIRKKTVLVLFFQTLMEVLIKSILLWIH